MRWIRLLMRGSTGLYIWWTQQLFNGRRVFGNLSAAPKGAFVLTLNATP